MAGLNHMDIWSLCYDKDYIRHDLLVNLFFNHFMDQGAKRLRRDNPKYSADTPIEDTYR